MQRSDTYTAQPAATPNADGSLPTPAGCPPLLNDFQISDIAALTTPGVDLFRTFAEATRIIQTGQVRAFNVFFSKEIGGYPKTALVTDPNDPTRLFISTKEDNDTNPTTDTSGAWFALTDTLTAAREAIAKEEERAKAAEAGLQSGLSAEAQRAQNAEGTLQSGLTTETNRAKEAEAGLQSGLSAEAQRAQNAETTLQNGLTIETNRAKEAEAGLQSGLSAEAQRAQNVEAGLQPKGDYATNTALTAAIQNFHDAESTFISGTFGLTTHDKQGIGLHTRGDDNAVLYNDGGNEWRPLASLSDVYTEAQRAQNAENTKLNISGGTISGNLEVNGSLTSNTIQPVPNDNLTLTFGNGNTLRLQKDGNLVGYKRNEQPLYVFNDTDSFVKNHFSVIDDNSPNNINILPSQTINGLLRGAIGWNNTYWYPGGDGLIVTPNGNTLLESDKTSGPSVIQRFTTTGKQGERINFPKSFSDDNVQISISVQDSGKNMFHVTNYFDIDRYGFSLSINTWSGKGFANEANPTQILVIAVGSP